MRVAVQILSTNTEPSTTNIKAMKETFIALSNLKHEYDFYFYYGDHSYYQVYNNENIYRVNLPYKESIYNTYEKGIHTLKYILGYDWHIRMNISCFLNLKLLDNVIDKLDEDIVYCNAINSYINDEHYYNDIYPRGDFMLFSNKTAQGILDNSDKYIRCDEALENRINIPHVDDCLFGLCIKDYFGPDYYKHLQMLKYNYMPQITEQAINFNKYCISSRVKTNPPGVNYSGYSWKDNEYRRFDAAKMRAIHELIKDIDYSEDIKIEDLYDNTRTTLFVSLSSQPIQTFNNYLHLKTTKGAPN